MRPTRLATVWSPRLLAIVVVAGFVLSAHGQIDRQDLAVPARAIAAGHLGAAYPHVALAPRQTSAFQAPGFPLFAGLVIAAWHRLSDGGGAAGALTFAALCTAALVVVAGCWLVNPAGTDRRRERVFLLALAASPFFREALGDYFHPDDVLALGLMLLALHFAFGQRWGWAGVCAGLAVASKQWAVMALPALTFAAPTARARASLLGVAAAVGGIVYLPFLLANRVAAERILQGPVPIPGGFVPQTTVEGMLRSAPFHLPLADVDAIARMAPVLFAAGAALAWAARTRRRSGTWTLDPAAVVGLVVATEAFRLVADCIALSYYALPLVVLVAVVDARRSAPLHPPGPRSTLSGLPIFALAAAWALGLWYGSPVAADLLDPWSAALVFTAGVAVVAVGGLRRLAAARPRLPPPPDGPIVGTAMLGSQV